MHAVAPQLGGRVAQRVLIVQVKVEVVFAQGEPVRRGFQPPPEIVREARQRRSSLLRRRHYTPDLGRRHTVHGGPHVTHEGQPALGDPQRGFHEHPHRLYQRRARVVQQPRHVLQPARERACPLGGRTIAPAQQEVQPAEQVRQPEPGVLRLGALALESLLQHAHVVQERRAVDLVLELARRGLFQSGADGLECGEVWSERDGTEPPVAVVVGRHARLGRRDGVQVPAQVEVGPLDFAERPYRHTACFRSR